MATLGELIPSKKIKKEKLENGYVLFEGASNINGEPIMGILTVKSSNDKTGNMAQLWIMRSDVSPIEASKSKKDDAICGNCTFRQSLGGACYVNIGQAPLSVYRTYKKGKYPKIDINSIVKFKGLAIRFGAYGDPYALPISILAKLKSVAKNNTSYTHQWREGDEVLKSLSMASVDNISEQIEATKKGWRTFRVATENSNIMDNEIICPNYTTGVQCVKCGLCSGASKKAKNVVALVHGTYKSRFDD